MRWLILRIGADYFVRPPRDLRYATPRQRLAHHALTALKNLSGLVLLAAGVVMLFTPGPGLLAMVLGLSLMSFPGKRRFEERLLCQPRILHAANRLRARHGTAPLISPRSLLAEQSVLGYGLNYPQD
jgi:hypothetical protein